MTLVPGLSRAIFVPVFETLAGRGWGWDGTKQLEAGVQAEAGRVADSLPQGGMSRRILRSETLLVLAISLGASAVSALISFVGSLTKPGSLKQQAATLNGSFAPGRPWLDLAWQLFDIATALVPVLLVAHLLFREGAGLRSIGFDRTLGG